MSYPQPNPLLIKRIVTFLTYPQCRYLVILQKGNCGELHVSGVGYGLCAQHLPKCNASRSYNVVQRGTIDTLPENVLLEVFNSYRQVSQHPEDRPWKWDTLIQVCRKWRNIVLASPRRLDLWLLCTYRTSVRMTLDYWPSLPIVISYCASLKFRSPSPEDEDNVIAALEHHNRVREIQLAVTSSLLGKIVKLMHVSFPRLTSLSLWLDKGCSNCMVPSLPHSFLGGYAPLLRDLSLIGIPFPDLPGLLSATMSLTSLRLLEVPDTGYITPRAMATCLSLLINLAIFCLEFRLPTPRPDNERGHPLPPNWNRATLPTLTHFNFRGTSDYLEGLLARIDAPSLDHVDITFFNQLIFQVPHLSHFIGRMEMLKSARVAELESSFGSGVSIKLGLPGASATPNTAGYPLSLCVSCGVLDWQISSMAQICSQSSIFSRVERLDVRADYLRLGYRWEDETVPWVDFFRWFTSVETLSISGELCQHVAHALELEVVAVAEVLPELRVLDFECSRKSASVENYVAVRETFGRPVNVQYVRSFPGYVSYWER